MPLECIPVVVGGQHLGNVDLPIAVQVGEWDSRLREIDGVVGSGVGGLDQSLDVTVAAR